MNSKLRQIYTKLPHLYFSTTGLLLETKHFFLKSILKTFSLRDFIVYETDATNRSFCSLFCQKPADYLLSQQLMFSSLIIYLCSQNRQRTQRNLQIGKNQFGNVHQLCAWGEFGRKVLAIFSLLTSEWARVIFFALPTAGVTFLVQKKKEFCIHLKTKCQRTKDGEVSVKYFLEFKFSTVITVGA